MRWRAPGTTPDPSGVGVLDLMGGGYRGWSFGEWNALKPFDERGIKFDPQDPFPDFAPMLMDPPHVTGDDGEALTLSFRIPVVSDVVDGVVDGGKAIGRGVGVVAEKGTEVVEAGARLGEKAFRGAVGLGVHLVSGFVGLIYDTLFCRRIVGVRVTEADNSGLDISVGPASGGFSVGDVRTRADLLDMNGDLYPDEVTAAGIRYGTGKAFEKELRNPLPFGNPRHVRQRGLQGGLGLGGSHTLRSKVDAIGNSEGFVGATIGAGLNYAVSSTDRDLVDVNGDGLPDHVSSDGSGNVVVRLNFGYRFGSPSSWPARPWGVRRFSASPNLLSQFGGDLSTDNLRVEDTSAARLSGGFNAGTGQAHFGVSAGETISLVRSVADLIDLNGDRLPDQLLKVPGEPFLRVKLNLGGAFGPEKRVPVTAWSTAGVQIDPPQLLGFGLGSADALGFSTIQGFSGGVNGGGTVIAWGIPITVSGSLGYESNRHFDELRFEDVDGDGAMDHALKLHANGAVLARLNKGSKANLLRRVERPLGGSFELDYRREGNRVDLGRTPKVDMPGNRWVVASVKLFDGQTTAPLSFAYSYGGEAGEGAFYDRAEREDYGFSHVRTVRGDGSVRDDFFLNQTPFEKGLLAESVERESAGGSIARRIVNGYDVRAVVDGVRFPALTRRDTQFQESSTANPATPVPTLTERWDYDATGNVTFYGDEGEAADRGDDIGYTVRFDQTELAERSYIFRPTSIEARGGNGALLRRRLAHYRPDGAPDRLTNVIIGGKQPESGAAYAGADATNAVWTYGYDSFGNISQVVDPKGFDLRYGYDAATSTYRTSITESSPGFGYSSTSSYDVRFGLPSEVVDSNGQIHRTKYDEFGRPAKMWGPNDVEGGRNAATPTLAFSYGPAVRIGTDSPALFQPAFAVTRRKDVAADLNAGDPARWDPIDSVRFVDGLDRTIQKKRDLEKDAGTGTATLLGSSVSGKVLFDSRGRLYKQGQPIFDAGPATGFVAVPLVRETTFKYDTLSRQREVTTADGAVTQTSYQLGAFDGRTLRVKLVKDPNGKVSTGYRDVRDQPVATSETNRIRGTPTVLTTRFTHDPIGQLVRVQDPKGNVTTAEYDSVGQLVAATNPDAGRTEWRYDRSGNLGAKETPQLRARRQLIRYVRDFNRLARIDYPDTPDVVYGYGEPGEAGDGQGNRAGRLSSETSEAGFKEWTYDRLGNVATEKVSLVDDANPESFSYRHETGFRHDSFGRLLELRYATKHPEVIRYGYDRGGNLVRATGTRTDLDDADPKARTPYLAFMGYDEFEQRTRTLFGNGVETRLTYDPATRRLTGVATDYQDPALQLRGAGPQPMQRLSYRYDLVGNVLSLSNDVPVAGASTPGAALVGPAKKTFGYDDLYQLTSADALYQPEASFRYRHSVGYAYDEINNVTRKDQKSLTDTLVNGEWTFAGNDPYHHYAFDYHYDGPRPHAPTSTDEESFDGDRDTRRLTYDPGGNQQEWSYDGGGITRTYRWTEEDRVRAVVENGDEISRNRYDGSGNRTHQEVPDEETLYVGPHLTVRNGNVETKHVFAGGVRIASKVELRELDDPETFYYHPDHLQSTHFMSDERQVLVEHDEYFPSGELWVDESGEVAAVRPRYLFNGKEFEESTGLYAYGDRHYDPRLNLWTRSDPSLPGYLRGAVNGGAYMPLNLSVYSYAWNNPLALRDQRGDSPTVATAAVGCLIGAVCGAAGRMIANAVNGRPISEGVGAATVGGAVTGGLAGLTLGGSLLATTVGGGLASTIGGGVTRAIETGGDPQMTVQNMAIDFTVGAVMSYAGARMSQVEPAPPVRAPVEETPNVPAADIPRITEKGVNRVEAHLQRLEAASEPPNAAMLQRLRSGQATPHDQAFYMHELKESALMNRGVPARDAHLQTLEWQGIPYRPGYESQLYHPDVIRAYPEYFNPAAHPRK